MTHDPKIIDIKEVSDTFVAYTIRCCNEELHTSVHSISVLVPNHSDELEKCKKQVAELHEAKLRWRLTQTKD
jgi:hypothetical protein